MTGFADIHHHLLYGLDDGPRRMEETAAMLHRAAAEGITTLVATPHVTPGVQRFDRDAFLERLAEARQYCAAQQLPLTLHAGAELLYTPQTARFLREGRVPTLGNTPYALVEFSPDVRFDTLESALVDLLRSGFPMAYLDISESEYNGMFADFCRTKNSKPLAEILTKAVLDRLELMIQLTGY